MRPALLAPTTALAALAAVTTPGANDLVNAGGIAPGDPHLLGKGG